MMSQRAYKTELNLNDKQRTTCLQHAGVARFAYNWGLERRNTEYSDNGKSANAIELHRELNKLKQTEFPWMYEVSKCAPQEALRDLDRAFKNFFEHRTKYPKFKSKKRGIGSFRLTGTIRVFEEAIQLPRLGRLRLKESGYLPTDTHILSATVSERAGKWFVSVQIEEEINAPANNGTAAGVDLGITSLATISDGTIFENPKALRTYERKLKRQQRKVSRKKKGGKNRGKAVKKLQKIHARISHIREDAVHKATTWLAKSKSVIVLEDLNVRGMLKNRHLSKSVSDASFGMFRRQVEYKACWYGSTVLIADRFYPSSKTCSRCGCVKIELKLSERVFTCDACGLVVDRELNASRNLENLAASWAESLNACKRGEHWLPHNRGGETALDEAGIELRLGAVSNG